jgi:hypothetical protein
MIQPLPKAWVTTPRGPAHLGLQAVGHLHLYRAWVLGGFATHSHGVPGGIHEADQAGRPGAEVHGGGIPPRFMVDNASPYPPGIYWGDWTSGYWNFLWVLVDSGFG